MTAKGCEKAYHRFGFENLFITSTSLSQKWLTVPIFVQPPMAPNFRERSEISKSRRNNPCRPAR